MGWRWMTSCIAASVVPNRGPCGLTSWNRLEEDISTGARISLYSPTCARPARVPTCTEGGSVSMIPMPAIRASLHCLILVALLGAGLAGGVVPRPVLARPATAITSAYMAGYASCIASDTCLISDLQPQTAFPSGVTSVCVVVLGSFQSGDQLTATIFDSQGRVAWNSGPTTQQSLLGSGNAGGLSGLYFSSPDGSACSQYGLAITASWPDGLYRTVVNYNGPVVQS